MGDWNELVSDPDPDVSLRLPFGGRSSSRFNLLPDLRLTLDVCSVVGSFTLPLVGPFRSFSRPFSM